MNKRTNLLVLLLLLSLTACPSSDTPDVKVFFSPNGGCTDAIVKALSEARVSVKVQAYSFTSAPIAKALLEAHQRGVQVQVILDESQKTEQYSEADFLFHAEVPTLIDAKHRIAHNKIMVIDEETVITGSFNFTKGAEHENAENLLIIRDKELAKKYLENFEEHKNHSEPYQGRMK